MEGGQLPKNVYQSGDQQLGLQVSADPFEGPETKVFVEENLSNGVPGPPANDIAKEDGGNGDRPADEAGPGAVVKAEEQENLHVVAQKKLDTILKKGMPMEGMTAPKVDGILKAEGRRTAEEAAKLLAGYPELGVKILGYTGQASSNVEFGILCTALYRLHTSLKNGMASRALSLDVLYTAIRKLIEEGG